MFISKLKTLSGLLLLAGSLFAFASCENEDETPVFHALTVNLTLPEGLSTDEIEHLAVITTNSRGVNDTLYVTNGLSVTDSILQGQYSIKVTGNVIGTSDTYVSGTSNVSLYQDATVAISLEKLLQSPLIFKAIYSTGGMPGYVVDQYFEIVNNSDEVQYLDGLIMSSPMGNQTQPNAWQANGMEHLYACGQGSVVAFPGNGTEYPLQPGESVVVANDATNHAENAGEGNHCPDLSGADWEIYLDYSSADADNESAPNLDVIFYNNTGMRAFGLGFFGRAYLLAKLPAGMTPAAYAADPANIQTTPGTTSTMQFLMIPNEYVLDAVDIWNANSEEHYGTFLSRDDAQGVLASDAWQGKCIRRKVTRIENGRAYYQDTNNSANDFLNNQPLTPGQTPTTVD